MRGDNDREWSCVLPTVKHVDLRQLGLKEYLVRFGLGAAISIVAGIIGLTVGTRFGGCFLAFPSILPASLTLIQEKESTRRADRNAIGAVLGAAGLVVFAMIGEASFGYIEPYLALPFALLGWLVTACALYAILAYVRPDTCDRGKDLGCRRGRGCCSRVPCVGLIAAGRAGPGPDDPQECTGQA